MMYDERFVTPMRQELTQLGVEEMRTAQEVDARLKSAQGTTLVVVNSVCGCAARNARPAVAKAIQHDTRPQTLTTVFAGQDVEAVQRARSYFTGYAPSSPLFVYYSYNADDSDRPLPFITDIRWSRLGHWIR